MRTKFSPQIFHEKWWNETGEKDKLRKKQKVRREGAIEREERRQKGRGEKTYYMLGKLLPPERWSLDHHQNQWAQYNAEGVKKVFSGT